MYDNEIKIFLADLIGLSVSEISFVRGYGIVEDYFVLIFENSMVRYRIEVETNFRIVDCSRVLLVFNDLYLDADRREISVKRYRKQQNIEKTLLSQNLKLVNERLHESCVINSAVFQYGDVIIYTDSGINIEITNDTHLEDATLYRICKMTKDDTLRKVVMVKNGELCVMD